MTMTHREKIDKVLDLYPEMSHTMVIPESLCDAMLEKAAQDEADTAPVPIRPPQRKQWPLSTEEIVRGTAMINAGHWMKGYLQQAIKSSEPAAVKMFAAKALADWFLACPEMGGSK